MNAVTTDLIARLESADAGIRQVALLEFADEGETDLLPAVVNVLRHDDDPALRAEAARALAGHDDIDVVRGLADALRDVPNVREIAFASLTELKDPSVGAALIPYIDDPDPFVIAGALRAIKELRLPAAAEPASRALTHSHAGVRREAVGVLGWLKWLDALGAIADRAVHDSDEEVRRISCGALGMAAPVSELASAALIVALRDRAWQLREEAATTLGKFEWEPRISAALRKSLEDDHWQVRLRAARSLGRMRDELSVPLLIASLIHPVGNLRKESAIALGGIGDATAIPALNAAAVDPDPEVRKAVRLALQQLEPSR